jgi:hypothetical protein
MVDCGKLAAPASGAGLGAVGKDAFAGVCESLKNKELA